MQKIICCRKWLEDVNFLIPDEHILWLLRNIWLPSIRAYVSYFWQNMAGWHMAGWPKLIWLVNYLIPITGKHFLTILKCLHSLMLKLVKQCLPPSHFTTTMKVYLNISSALTPGSVIAKQDLISPLRSGIKYFSFISSVPYLTRTSMLPVSGALQLKIWK